MVAKSIAKILVGGKQKPKQFPEGSKFQKEEAQTLLQEAQKKVEKIEAQEIKPVNTADLIKSSDDLVISGSKVAPVLTPQKVIKKTVSAPKSSKQKVDEFLTEEERILNEADLSPQKQLDEFNINTFNTSEDV